MAKQKAVAWFWYGWFDDRYVGDVNRAMKHLYASNETQNELDKNIRSSNQRNAMGRCREGRNADATVRGPARWCVCCMKDGERRRGQQHG